MPSHVLITQKDQLKDEKAAKRLGPCFLRAAWLLEAVQDTPDYLVVTERTAFSRGEASETCRGLHMIPLATDLGEDSGITGDTLVALGSYGAKKFVVEMGEGVDHTLTRKVGVRAGR